MSKMLATCAAIAVTAMIALPMPAGAAEKGVSGATQSKQNELTDVSAARRHYRYGYARHRYYRPYYSRGYYRPYNSYAYDPYYRPYYRPGLSVGVGPFGFGFGF
jgi:hypothetical protein